MIENVTMPIHKASPFYLLDYVTRLSEKLGSVKNWFGDTLAKNVYEGPTVITEKLYRT